MENGAIMVKVKNKWLLSVLIIVLALVLAAVGIGGKKYMDKRAIEKDYQQGVEIIQKYVSDYLVNNYEGIEKIEWQGVGVEWRSSPMFGSSILGNYVNSKAKIVVSKDKFFTVRFTLTDETEYDNDLKKYVRSDSLNPENTDFSIQSDLENATYNLSEEEKAVFNKFKKSTKGSPNTQIIYNLEIHELEY